MFRRLNGEISVMAIPCNLIELLEQCERDTREVLGEGAAKRLARWHNHAADQARLVKFVKDRIHGDKWENGVELHRVKKLSLERIVIECGAPMFEKRDVERAKATLSMA